MKIKQTQQNTEFLRVDEGFATLIDATKSQYTYEIRYYVKALDALKNNSSIVRISATKLLTLSPRRVLDDKNIRDADKLITGLLTAESAKKDATRAISSNILARQNSDITRSISNTAASDNKQTSLKTSVRVINVAKQSDTQNKNSPNPVLQTMYFTHASAPAESTAKKTSIDLLMKGIDPALAGSTYNCVNGTYSTSLGIGHIARLIGQTSNSFENASIEIKQANLVTSLYDTTKQTITTDDTAAPIPTISRVETEYSMCVERLSLDANVFGLNDFFVTLEMLKGNNVVQSITKLIDHSDNILVYNTPRLAPYVGIAPNRFPGKNVIELQQLDETASAIRIMRKTVNNTRLSLLRSEGIYEHVTDIALSKRDGLTKIVDIVNNSAFVIYRCIPLGLDGTLCAEFSSAVATPVFHPNVSKKYRNTFASLTTKNTPEGVEIVVADVSDNVFSVAVKRRNLSKYEQNDLSINEEIKQTVNKLKTNTFVDKQVKHGNVYEYSCYLYFDDGIVEKSFNVSIIEHFRHITGVATASVSGVTILNDGSTIDVSFNVRSDFIRNDIDNIYAALHKQGYDNLFIDSILKERNDLHGIFAHDIKRINLTTGICETFGTIIEEKFVDSSFGRSRGIEKLKLGHSYKYIITTLLRSVETVFDKFIKSASDDSTGNEYDFSPAKYKHPITANGTHGSRATIRNVFAQDEFAFGYVGNSIDIDVYIKQNTSVIESVSAQRVNRLTARIDWKLNGQVIDIDHFIIMKEILGHMKIIGKSHSSSPGKLFSFFDTLTEDDIGELKYSIVPIYLDYARGNSMTSNTITVYDARIKM